MIKNFYEFYEQFVTSEAPVAKLLHQSFCKKHSASAELDCNLVTLEDFQNLVLMEEFLGQTGIYIKNLEKELSKKPRTKKIERIQKSCLQTLKKHPKAYFKRDWIHRYAKDPRTPEQQEKDHLSIALITLGRDGIEAFAKSVAGNLDLMTNETKKDEQTK